MEIFQRRAKETSVRFLMLEKIYDNLFVKEKINLS